MLHAGRWRVAWNEGARSNICWIERQAKDIDENAENRRCESFYSSGKLYFKRTNVPSLTVSSIDHGVHSRHYVPERLYTAILYVNAIRGTLRLKVTSIRRVMKCAQKLPKAESVYFDFPLTGHILTSIAKNYKFFFHRHQHKRSFCLHLCVSLSYLIVKSNSEAEWQENNLKSKVCASLLPRHIWHDRTYDVYDPCHIWYDRLIQGRINKFDARTVLFFLTSRLVNDCRGIGTWQLSRSGEWIHL